MLKAIQVLRDLNATDARNVRKDAPTGFVRRRWKPHVFRGEEIDRRFYELCVLSELRNALRSGDLRVVGSRQFRDFEQYLLPAETFTAMKPNGLPLAIDTNCRDYLNQREAELHESLTSVNALAGRGELPDASLVDGVLKITPLTNAVPPEAEALARRVSAILPRIKITALLVEVDVWTAFTRHFVHLRNGDAATEAGAVGLFNARNGDMEWDHELVGTSPIGLVFSPDGEALAYADGSATVLDVRTGNPTKMLAPASGLVLAVAFSPDGRTLAGAGSHTDVQGGFGGEGRVTLWDVRTGAIRKTLKGPMGRAVSVVFAPDGRTLAAAGAGETAGSPPPPKPRESRVSEVCLFDAMSGGVTWVANGEAGEAFAIASSPDGKTLGFCDESYVYLVRHSDGRLINVLMQTTKRPFVRDVPWRATIQPGGGL